VLRAPPGWSRPTARCCPRGPVHPCSRGAGVREARAARLRAPRRRTRLLPRPTAGDRRALGRADGAHHRSEGQPRRRGLAGAGRGRRVRLSERDGGARRRRGGAWGARCRRLRRGGQPGGHRVSPPTLTFFGYERARAALTGTRVGGRLEATLPLVGSTDAAGDRPTPPVPFRLLGPGDVGALAGGTVGTLMPASGTPEAETSKCVYVEVTPA